jgi:hypothetical protein
MMHAYHEALPGFDPEAIWHDGCEECEYRGGQSFEVQLAYLDSDNVRRAWERAGAWGRDEVTPNGCEASLLRSICAARWLYERVGV